MKFYSGFSLYNDQQLFEEYIKDSEYTVSGFSFGAIKAFKYVLSTKSRVDTLQLFSPAFFQDKSEKFKRMQMMYMKKDKKSYLNNFFSSCFAPAQKDADVLLTEGSEEDLQKLLSFEWKVEELKALEDKGIAIEVYLGSEDKIIDSNAAKEFFLPFSTTYMINHAGHTLQS